MSQEVIRGRLGENIEKCSYMSKDLDFYAIPAPAFVNNRKGL